LESFRARPKAIWRLLVWMEQSVTEKDESLVQRSQHGDRAAFEELVRRVARLVFVRIYLETNDSHRAEDLTQETFLTAWKSIGQVTDASGFRKWLLAIAHTTVIDAARREKRKKRSGNRVGEEVLAKLEYPGPEPSDAAETLETREEVLAALRAIPEEYRMPITLRYIGGADYETIGKQLGVTNGSLRGLLNRGMRMLRARLLGEKSKTEDERTVRTS
jgi:RNA polymerase sigma-70 factor (ECF subfamily)